MPDLGIAEILATAAVIVFWVAIIVLIGRGVVSLFRRRDPAMETLRTRLARGDIDQAEYDRLRTTLQRG